jgi:hypothetical protein
MTLPINPVFSEKNIRPVTEAEFAETLVVDLIAICDETDRPIHAAKIAELRSDVPALTSYCTNQLEVIDMIDTIDRLADERSPETAAALAYLHLMRMEVVA